MARLLPLGAIKTHKQEGHTSIWELDLIRFEVQHCKVMEKLFWQVAYELVVAYQQQMQRWCD